MIHIDRSQSPIPKILTSQKTEKEKKKCEKFFRPKRRSRTQKRHTFLWNIYKHAEVRKALLDLFNGKCAYCETPLTGAHDIDHFRPKSGALGTRGKSDPDHYWWLAYDWENLLPVCTDCDRNKRTYFPVAGKRASFGATGDKLEKEKPLLINPCLDQPELYLYYNKNGMVHPRRILDATRSRMLAEAGISHRHLIKKATTSINVYGLNRPFLIQARKECILKTQYMLTRPKPNEEDFERFRKISHEALSVRKPYLGLVRQLVEEWIVTTIGTRNVPRLTKEFLLGIAATHNIPLPLQDIKKTKKWEKAARPIRKAVRITEEEIQKEIQTVRTGYISNIEIGNFKGLNRIQLGFPGEQSDRATWKVLLGENGVGKSSILQAVSLALLGKQRLSALSERVKLDTSRLLRHRTKKGWVTIKLTDRKDPVHLVITSKGFNFESGEEGVNTFLNAYGTTRLVPLINLSRDTKVNNIIMCENLFNPFTPLLDVNEYLFGLKHRIEFDRMAMALKDLMNLSVDSKVIKRDGKIWVQIGPGYNQLDEMGDGYQSIAVISTDIFKNYPEKLTDLRQAVGIVLVDEIGTYLHPEWRLKIISNLRTAFPGIQFLVTTHDPLCLRGLGDKEIAVVERDEETDVISIDDNILSTKHMSVDQLLTSKLFGLISTYDPEIETHLQDYYSLLAKPSLKPEEVRQRDKLQKTISQYNIKLGGTKREQLIYEAADEYLAKKRIQRQEETPEERDRAKQQILDLWTEYEKAKAK